MQRFLATAALLVLTLSCSPVADPPPAVTLLVLNGSCTAGHCDSLRVLGFPSNQPLTPGGFWSIDLGSLTGRQACSVIPPSATFRVIGINADSSRDTVTFTWTGATALSLGAQPPSSSRLQAAPSTTSFVPMQARGWQITLPGGTEPVPAAPCIPQ